MTLYGSNPDVVISPTVIVVFGTVCFIFGMAAVVNDILVPAHKEANSVAVATQIGIHIWKQLNT
jgi:hypothetical protein